MKTAAIRLNHLVKLKTTDPKTLFDKMLSAGNSRYTIKTSLEVFKGYERFAFRTNKVAIFLKENKFVFKNAYHEKQASLTSAAFKDLLKAVENEIGFYNFCVLAGLHGLRSAEALSVNWQDIENGTIRVQGKGGKVRFVPLVEGVLRFPSHPQPEGQTRIVDALPPNYRQILKQFTITPHDLRAFFATSISEFLTPFEMAEVLGHSDIKTTMKYVRKNASSIKGRINDYARIYRAE